MYVNQFFISSISNLGNSCTGLEIVGKLQKVWEKKSSLRCCNCILIYLVHIPGGVGKVGIGWSRIKQCRMSAMLT